MEQKFALEHILILYKELVYSRPRDKFSQVSCTASLHRNYTVHFIREKIFAPCICVFVENVYTFSNRLTIGFINIMYSRIRSEVVCRSVLQCATVYIYMFMRTSEHTSICWMYIYPLKSFICTAVDTATHCSTCNALHHTAPHCNTPNTSMKLEIKRPLQIHPNPRFIPCLENTENIQILNTVCLCVVCVRCPPTHSFCLRWQIILEIKTTDADKCAVRLLQPFVFAHALYAWGCFGPCLWLFPPIEHLFACFPQYALCRPQWSVCYSCLVRCSTLRGMRPTNLSCFGMWISGGRERTIRHDCSM